MDMLKKQGRIFLRAPRICVAYLIELAVLLADLIYQACMFSITHDAIWFLHKIQVMCLPVFIFSLYCAYEYIYKLRTCGIEEAVAAHPLGKIKLYGYGLLVLAGSVAVPFLIMDIFAAVIAWTVQLPADYHLHVLLVSVRNTLLTGVLASLAGALFALKLKRVKAYGCMAILVFLMIPASDVIPGIAYDSYHINIWPVKACFSDILPPNLTWTLDYQYGLSIEPFRWDTVLFWIFGLAALLCLCILKGKGRLRAACAIFCAAGMVLNICAYSLGGSKIDLSLAPASTLMEDLLYYRRHVQKEEKADFSISDYDMQIKIGRQLDAKVSLGIRSSSPLNQYPLTLYHGYTVSKIQGENGKELPFDRDGDYITVSSETPLKNMTIFYSGYSPILYSNVQGVNLPGCFPYYPWAGYHRLYNADASGGVDEFIPYRSPDTAQFTLDITGGKQIQTNLARDPDDGKLRGKTNALTIMGGFLERTDHWAYPACITTLKSSRSYMAESDLDALQDEITKLEKQNARAKPVNLKDYTIFQMNESMQRAGYVGPIVMDNHILMPALGPGNISSVARLILEEAPNAEST